ncbi:MAG TPA: hypothetical protein GXZ60_03560, partial [Intrasporangiaceae bacterium]|nr:hypothetical protein [Intrasporangiaceae bacterium]
MSEPTPRPRDGVLGVARRPMSPAGEPAQTPWRVLGGPLGRHTAARSAGVGALVRLAVLLTALPMLLALALRAWCLQHGFAGQQPLWRACYSDLPAMLGNLRLGASTNDPVVPATVLRALAGLAGGVDARAQTLFVLLWALVALVLLAVCTVAIGAYRPDRVLLFVLCPALALGLLISGDLVGVTLIVVGIVAWHRRHDLTAGVALGLAVLSGALALAVVVAVALLSRRIGRSLRRMLLTGAATVAATCVITVGLSGTSALTDPVLAWWRAVPSYGSLWVLPTVASTSGSQSAPAWFRQLLEVAVVSPAAMTVISLLGWVLAIGLIRWLVRAPFRPSLADLALVGVVVVLLTAPAIPVQASLWLVPLVAMSSLPRRDLLIWAGVEVAYFAMVWPYLGGLENADRGLPGGWYALFLALRVGAIAYLVWGVIENARYG